MVEYVRDFYEEMLKTDKNYDIPSRIYSNLSRTQFLRLLEAIPSLVNKDNYLEVWLKHSYCADAEQFAKQDLTISEKDEKRKSILKILKDLEALNTTKTKSMRRAILRELLVLDISREEVDKAVFL